MVWLWMMLWMGPLEAPSELAFSVRGEGRPLLLLAGLGNTSAIWSDLAAQLPSGYQLVLVEPPGLGDGTLKPPFDWADLERAALGVMDRLGHPRFSVAGISWGSFWAQRLALAVPDRVDHLILISSTLGGTSHVPPSAQVLQALFFNPDTSLAGQVAVLKLVLDETWCRENEPRLQAMAQARIDQPFPAHIKTQQTLLGMTFDMTDRAKEILCPTLVIHGEGDQVVPSVNGERLAAAIQGSRLVRLANAGHVCIIDQAQRCAQSIAAFIPVP